MGIIPAGRGFIVTPSTSRSSSTGKEFSKEQMHFIATGLILCALITLICICRWFFKFRHVNNIKFHWRGKYSFNDYLEDRYGVTVFLIKLFSITITVCTIVFFIIYKLSKIIF